MNGTINVCPNIDSVSANPPVGNTIALGGSASDSDNGPQPVCYGWTTSSGTLSSATAQNPTLTCTAPGAATLTLTVTDGDAGCATSFTVPVICPSDSVPRRERLGRDRREQPGHRPPADAVPGLPVDHRRRRDQRDDASARCRSRAAVRPTSTDTTLAEGDDVGRVQAGGLRLHDLRVLLPAGAVHASVAGIKLALPKSVVNRVVIIGDTGCRIQIGKVYQACGDPTQWPFSVIS